MFSSRRNLVAHPTPQRHPPHPRLTVVLHVVHNERQFNESDIPESTAPPVSPRLPLTFPPKCPFTTTSLVYWLTPAHLATRKWVGLGWIAATSSCPPPLLWTLSTHISLRNNIHHLLVDSCTPDGSEFHRTGLWIRKKLDSADKLRSHGLGQYPGWDAEDTEGDVGCVRGIGRTRTSPPLLVRHCLCRRSLPPSSTAFDISISPTTSLAYSSTCQRLDLVVHITPQRHLHVLDTPQQSWTP